jgi:regulator of RNase E activity RraA
MRAKPLTVDMGLPRAVNPQLDLSAHGRVPGGNSAVRTINHNNTTADVILLRGRQKGRRERATRPAVCNKLARPNSPFPENSIQMDTPSLFAHLRQFDTPTIANALEIALGKRFASGFTRQSYLCAFPKLPAIVGFARTATIRCSTPYDPAVRRKNQIAYYEYVARGEQPTIAVIQDVDSQPGLGAFWGEVNTHVHWGLGCVGTLTNGSMRDLDAMQPQFQCFAATLSPSHAWVQVVEIGKPVEVMGLAVADGDIVHADRHGAVTIPRDVLEKLPAAIDLMARREKVILDAARKPGFGVAALKEAFAASDQIK